MDAIHHIRRMCCIIFVTESDTISQVHITCQGHRTWYGLYSHGHTGLCRKSGYVYNYFYERVHTPNVVSALPDQATLLFPNEILGKQRFLIIHFRAPDLITGPGYTMMPAVTMPCGYTILPVAPPPPPHTFLLFTAIVIASQTGPM